MKRIILTLIVVGQVFTAVGQRVLTLDSCRAMAIANNKTVKMDNIDEQIAQYNKKAAFSKFFPRINATGAYFYTSKNINLISEEQENALKNAGTNISGAVGQTTTSYLEQLQSNPQFLQILQANPMLAQIVQNGQAALPQMQQQLAGIGGAIDAAGAQVADALTLQTHNITVASILLTQPVYMGGKIIAYNKITDYLLEVEKQKGNLQNQEVVVQVDQAYWQIVSLQSKKQLAQSYLNLLNTLDGNVEKMIQNGFATKADGLNVKVKLNEAEVTMIQIDNGIALSKMLLCQICGMDFDTNFTLADENVDNVRFIAENYHEDLEQDSLTTDINAANRPELNQLDLANKIYEEKIKIARSEYLPNVAIMGGYTLTNPSSFDGFENKFGGMWVVGAVAKIPIFTAGERIYKVRAAKLEADKANSRLDETREKIELQINQCAQRVQEARERLAVAKKSLEHADENLRYANVGLKEGVIPVSNVLEAQTAWLKAQTTLVQADIDLKLAKTNYNKAMGSL